MRYFNLFIIALLTGCFSEPPKPSVFQKQYSSGIVKTASLSHDGNFALTVDNTETCVWNNKEKNKIYPCAINSKTSFIELSGISGNNDYYFTSNRLNISLYRISDGILINQWSSGTNIINDIAISENGLLLLLGYRNGSVSTIDVVDDVFTTYKIHDLDINSVSLTRDGMKAFTGSSDKKAILWNIKTGDIISTFKHRSRVNHVDISSTGEKAFSIDAINDRFIWDLHTKSEKIELNTSLKFLEFNDSMFTKDAEKFITGSPNRKIQLWNTTNGELLQQWESYKYESRNRASVLAVSINKNKVITITSDGMYEEFEIQ